ncbi:H/ACA ribonucleoprotein complex subunit GAR1 like [Verticillium longisporum]|nr:H/ACA ribonucleoprotein complex subunit GAR1 like [Verticillium longisporum]
MSFRGGRGAPRGGFGGRGGGRGGFQQRDMGPPAQVLEMGKFLHACEGEMVCESINPKVPQFNAQMFLENKTSIGKIDEVLGPINQHAGRRNLVLTLTLTLTLILILKS